MAFSVNALLLTLQEPGLQRLLNYVSCICSNAISFLSGNSSTLRLLIFGTLRTCQTSETTGEALLSHSLLSSGLVRTYLFETGSPALTLTHALLQRHHARRSEALVIGDDRPARLVRSMQQAQLHFARAQPVALRANTFVSSAASSDVGGMKSVLALVRVFCSCLTNEVLVCILGTSRFEIASFVYVPFPEPRRCASRSAGRVQ